MSNLPGNPYATDALDQVATHQDPQAGALMTLAYEQRTSNLIALHQMTVNAILNGAQVSASVAELLERNSEEIEKRLGILEISRPAESGE